MRFILATIFQIFLIRLIVRADFQSMSYMKSKQINCGQFDLDDSFRDLGDEVYTHEEALKAYVGGEQQQQQQESNDATLKLITNLNSCLHTINEHNFTAYSIYIGSNLGKQIFNEYFDLGESNGLVYLKRKIDREILCAKIKKFNPERNFDKRQLLNNRPSKQHPSTDSTVNCECKSEKCELRFKFVAFKDAPPTQTPSSVKRRRIQHYHRQNTQVYKYISLSININDVNDNRPKFLTNFLHLNISEHIGSFEPLIMTPSTDLNKLDLDKLNDDEATSSLTCDSSKSYVNNKDPKTGADFHLLNLNTLVPIERAFDLDVGRNAEIKYKLVLINSENASLIGELESETNAILRENKVKQLLRYGGVKPCSGLFELVESSFNDDYYNYEAAFNYVNEYDQVISNKNGQQFLGQNKLYQEQLFLKVNTLLDREMRQVIYF